MQLHNCGNIDRLSLIHSKIEWI